MNMSVAYGITTVVSFLLAAGYLFSVKRKNSWLVLLLLSVFIVNLGYLALACSSTLEGALLANRIAYFGSVFLPLAMLMGIGDVCRMNVARRWVICLTGISIVVFLIAATPGYLDCYYKDVSLVFVNGMAKLQKTYGPLHSVYYVYLFSYFLMMAVVVVRSIRVEGAVAGRYGVILHVVVLLNICIWLVEQLAGSNFEFLAVTYIISEVLLLFLYDVMENDKRLAFSPIQPKQDDKDTEASQIFNLQEAENTAEPQHCAQNMEMELQSVDSFVQTSAQESSMLELAALYWPEFEQLSAREREVLQCILEDKKRKEIAETLCISENTVKTHISKLYSKLGVANRRELLFQMVQRQREDSSSA